MIVVTWNVLHRIHAENWREAVPDRFPVEAERIGRISRRIVALLQGTVDVVVCLQEVSGDQRHSLEAAVEGFDVVGFQLPRVPSLKAGGPCPLVDPTEHLVVIARQATVVRAEASPTDPGKGFIVVDVGGGITVVNTHVSGGGRGGAQLATLAAIPGERVVLCGDFNTSVTDVLSHLGPGFLAAPLPADALPTRPRTDAGSGKPPAIDHIFGRGLTPASGAVVDVEGESDHNLLRATVG